MERENITNEIFLPNTDRISDIIDPSQFSATVVSRTVTQEPAPTVVRKRGQGLEEVHSTRSRTKKSSPENSSSTDVFPEDSQARKISTSRTTISATTPSLAKKGLATTTTSKSPTVLEPPSTEQGYLDMVALLSLPDVSYANQGKNAATDNAVAAAVLVLNTAYSSTVQELFERNSPALDIKEFRGRFLAHRSIEIQKILAYVPVDPMAIFLQKVSNSRATATSTALPASPPALLANIPRASLTSSPPFMASARAPLPPAPAGITPQRPPQIPTNGTTATGTSASSDLPDDTTPADRINHILIGNDIFDSSTFFRKYFSGEDATISGNSVMILRSFIDKVILDTLPSPIGHKVDSFVPIVVTSFFLRNPHLSLSRYANIMPAKMSDLYNLLICNFSHNFSVAHSGFSFSKHFASAYGDFSTIERVFDMLSEVFSFLAHVLSPDFSRIVSEIIVPARNITSEFPPAVVLNFMSHYLSANLTIYTPLKIPVSVHIGNYLRDFSLLTEGAHFNFSSRLNKLTLTVLTQTLANPSSSIASGSASNGLNPVKGVKNGSNKPAGPAANNGSSRQPAAASLRKTMGPCFGFCLSTFFPKPCPRLAAGGLCEFSVNGVKTPLKHESEFQSLSTTDQGTKTGHFTSVIKPTLSADQVKFYS